MKKVFVLTLLTVLLLSGIRPAAAQDDKNIVEVAASNDDFSTLVTAIQAAGLAETLSGEGPYTVFAPTNAAFEKLPAGTLDALLADKAALTKVLTYHVVAGNVLAADVVGLNGETVATVEGENVTVSVNGTTVKINDSTVTQTDIVTSNGVIHVIDTVLIPPSIANATPAPQTMPQTGASNSFPLIAVAAGVLLIAGTFVFRSRTA